MHANRARVLCSAPPPSLINVPVYSRSLHTYRQNAPSMVTQSMAFQKPLGIALHNPFHVIPFRPCQMCRQHDSRCIEFRSLTLIFFMIQRLSCHVRRSVGSVTALIQSQSTLKSKGIGVTSRIRPRISYEYIQGIDIR